MRKTILMSITFALLWGLLSSAVCLGCGFMKPDALKNHPCFAMYWEAERLWETKRWEEAKRKFAEIVRKAPYTPFAAEARFKLGFYEASWGNHSKAISHFERVIAWMDEIREEGYEMEEIHEAKLHIAFIYMKEGRYEEALRLLRDVFYETTNWQLAKSSNALAREALRRKDHFERGSAHSCGEKALTFVLRSKGIHVSEKDFSCIAGKGPSVTFQALKEVALSKGLKVTGVRLDFGSLA